MGQRGSRIAPAAAAASETPAVADPTERLSLAAPSAAVVGAGVAGVHVAYELAKLGFSVTVFERRGDIAGGETRHALPFVGVGLIEPSISRTAYRSEVLRGLLFPAICPNLVAREHLLNTVFNPVVYRWMYGRVRSCFSDDEVMTYTNNLSCVSRSVVCELVDKYPQLGQHVLADPVVVLNEQKAPAVTAHKEPLMVDPVGWTRGLADVCARHHGVHFALGERLEGVVTYLKYDIESAKSIRVSKPSPADPEKRLYASERYDVVVLAAGADTGTMTLLDSRLPVLGLSGLSAVVRQPTGALKDALWALFQRTPSRADTATPAPSPPVADTEPHRSSTTTSLARPATATLALLSSQCCLYGYTRPYGVSSAADNGGGGAGGGGGASSSPPSSAVDAMLQAKVLPSPQETVLQGLLSLDCTVKRETHGLVSQQLQRIESYLRVKCGLSVPLASPSAAAAQADCDKSGVRVHEYVRAFTPDGVPIIDHNGGSFNTFVCCGFGDHAMDLAPGAAKVLGKLVEHQAHRLREEDMEKVETWGLLASKLSPSRRTQVEEDLQLLFNGADPESARPHEPRPAGEASSLTPLPFAGNPFSTDRLSGMVKKEVSMSESPTWLDRLYAVEDAFLTQLEPRRRRFHAKVSELAQRDGMPDWLHTVVFCYFYEGDNSPEALAQRQRHRQKLIELAQRYEAPPTAAADGETATVPLTAAERSTLKQAEMERRVREAFPTASR
ncbi:NAD(P)-binding FAD dependent oxidoreductase [Novymonas esmeraldas]|uniref:FAD-dependent oxidoreductase domain-containing protein 1 n=1 Tax=Novymonas esmeraldas TaxID=1808958 RepID=A0AAW0EKU6_9TRYP